MVQRDHLARYSTNCCDWMQEELSALRGELVALRGDFEFLQAEVSRLRRLVVSIRANQSEAESSLPSRAAYPESDISYSLI